MKKTVIILFASFLLSHNTHIDSLKLKDPSMAWKISLLPGMGQFYNNQYLKGALLLSLESKLVYDFSYNYLKYSVDKRNDIVWLIVGLYVYGLLDAYVEAHLSTFPKEDIGSKGAN
tara:strand:+ start:290 stop:637 length:348 start_codon:yes stop_codon:yes gene_type:complete